MTEAEREDQVRAGLRFLPASWFEDEAARRKRRDDEMRDIRELLEVLDNPFRATFTKRITERCLTESINATLERDDALLALICDASRAALSARHDELEAEIYEPTQGERP